MPKSNNAKKSIGGRTKKNALCKGSKGDKNGKQEWKKGSDGKGWGAQKGFQRGEKGGGDFFVWGRNFLREDTSNHLERCSILG